MRLNQHCRIGLVTRDDQALLCQALATQPITTSDRRRPKSKKDLKHLSRIAVLLAQIASPQEGRKQLLAAVAFGDAQCHCPGC